MVRRTKESANQEHVQSLDPLTGAVKSLGEFVVTAGVHIRPRPFTAERAHLTRKKDRRANSTNLRVIIPERVAIAAGFAPGMRLRGVILEGGGLTLIPLPGQDNLRVAFEAERVMARAQAQKRKEEAIYRSLLTRLPYRELNLYGRQRRRKVEKRSGIPRDWPNG